MRLEDYKHGRKVAVVGIRRWLPDEGEDNVAGESTVALGSERVKKFKCLCGQRHKYGFPPSYRVGTLHVLYHPDTS